jgi:hypothetical protein
VPGLFFDFDLDALNNSIVPANLNLANSNLLLSEARFTAELARKSFMLRRLSYHWAVALSQIQGRQLLSGLVLEACYLRAWAKFPRD